MTVLQDSRTRTVGSKLASVRELREETGVTSIDFIAEYLLGIPCTYSQEMIDELKATWVAFLNNQTQDNGD